MTEARLAFVSVEHPKMHEDVARQIARSIVRGDLRPGAALPSESTLIDRFNVSRPVIREAVRSLAQRGLIETSQGRRTVVRRESDWDTLDALVLAAHRDEGKIRPILRDFLWIRQRVEPELAAEAARGVEPALLADLKTILDRMESLVGSSEAFFEADIDFHNRIAAAVGNRVIARLMTTIGLLFNVSREPALDAASAPYGALEWHRAVYAGVAAGDPDAARRAMHDHLEWTAKRLLGEG